MHISLQFLGVYLPSVFVGHYGCKLDCKSSGSPRAPVKREMKPPAAMNFFAGEPVQCSFGGDKTTNSQPRRNAARVTGTTDTTPSGPPRKWKHRHISRHFSSTSEQHQADVGHLAAVPETTVKAYPSPSWLVAEQPVPLSSVYHHGLPVVKRGSPAPPAAILPNDLSRRFLADGTDVWHAASSLDVERSAMLRKRPLDDRHDAMPFAMSPNVARFPAFNCGITPTGYLIHLCSSNCTVVWFLFTSWFECFW